jgi:peptide/nickel transport system permease protein
MFYLAFISVLTLLGNLISDLLYAAVDPRVRLS